MKFITIRELRQDTAKLKGMLKKSDKLVLTSNGKPIALMTTVEEDSLEDEIIALRRARAMQALERTRSRSMEKGMDRLSMEEVDGIISRGRRQRKPKKSER